MVLLNNQFPWKLHKILSDADKKGYDSIVSWLPDGKSFQVHERSSFLEQILKIHFNQTKFKSFQRQLNLWGFERIREDSKTNKCAYFHPFFIKGNLEMCDKMTRKQIKNPNNSEEEYQPKPVPLSKYLADQSKSAIQSSAIRPQYREKAVNRASLENPSPQPILREVIQPHMGPDMSVLLHRASNRRNQVIQSRFIHLAARSSVSRKALLTSYPPNNSRTLPRTYQRWR